MNKFKKVTREEYLKFIKNWPNRLDFDCTGICEPPMGSYNDFSGNLMWPQSIVAKEFREWEGPGGELDYSMPGKFWTYYIMDKNE